MDPDVIVIGGGVGGLATAALLADAGLKPLVLERRHLLGGRAQCVERKGFTLNFGMHAIVPGYESPLLEVLRRLGKRVPFVEADNRKAFIYRDRAVHALPYGVGTLMASKLLPFPSRLNLIRVFEAILAANLDALNDVPLWEWLSRVTQDPHVHRYMLDMARSLHFTNHPHDLSAGHYLFTIRLGLQARVPAIYPVGGWKTLIQALREAVEERGGEIRTSVHVHTLQIRSGRVTAAWTDGERLRARAYVCAFPVQQAVSLLDAEPALLRRFHRYANLETTAGIVLDLCLDTVVDERMSYLTVPEESMVIGCPSLDDPTLVPKGGQLYQVLHFLDPDEVHLPHVVRPAKARMLQIMEEIFPGCLAWVVFKRFMIFDNLSGVRHKVGQTPRDLIQFHLPEIENLYFAGDSTGGVGVLSNIAFDSALKCSGLIRDALGAAA